MSSLSRAVSRLRATLPADSLRARFATGAFWALAGTAISQALLLASSVVVARFLGKEGFGELGVVRITVGMFGAFAGLRLGLTASKHVAEFRKSDPAKAGRIVALSLLVGAASAALGAVLLAVASPYLAAHTIRAPHLAPVLTMACGLLFFNTLTGVQHGVLAGFEAFKAIARANLIRGVLGFPLMIAGVYLWGLPGVVGGMVASVAAGCVVSHLALLREMRKAGVRLTCRNTRQEMPILWRFSLPAFLSGAMVGPVMWLAGAMLVRQPNGYAEMGMFDAAHRWGRMLLIVPGLLGTVVVPILSERLSATDGAQARKTLLMSMLTNAVLVVPAAVVLAVFSPWVMALFGAEFTAGWPVLVVVLAAVILMALQTSAGQVIAATGRMWTGAAMNFGWAVALLGMCRFLLDRGWGAQGMAVAHLFGYGVHSIWVFVFVHRLLRKPKRAAPPPKRGEVKAQDSDQGVEDEPYAGTAIARG